jgi:hypothetical protein
MHINELLKRLEEHKIYVEQERRFHDGRRVLIFRSQLPDFPHRGQKVWATLPLEPDQTNVEREEIEAVLRHLWHGSTLFFGDELEKELAPDNDHEREIATKVDAKARAIRDGLGTWDDNIIADMKIALGFEMSEDELEYLDLYVRMRREIPLT